jgi:hypothetical protein
MLKQMRQIKTYLKHFIVLLLKPIIKKCGFDLIPGYEKKLFTKFRFLDNKFFSPMTEPKIKDRINKLTIDSTFSKTELCTLGKNFPTDKSPYSEHKHRHPFTAVYDLLFSNIKCEEIVMAEIGIYENNSMKCWREYFKHGLFYSFDNNEKYLKQARNHNLPNVFYSKVDVKNASSISSTFQKIDKKFDIILDDSTHEFEDQIRIIKSCYPFLKTGGYLIIEDIFRPDFIVREKKYYEALNKLRKFFLNITFIDCAHINKWSPGWDNDKLLILIRNDVKV